MIYITRRTPTKIFNEFNNKIIDVSSAVKQLITLIENSTKVKDRYESLKILRIIGDNFENTSIKKEEIFNFFENLLISDTYEKIRNEAALILRYNFKDKALNPLRWALHHEESQTCLFTILDSLIAIINNLEKRNVHITKLILIHEINQIDDNDFKISFQTLSFAKGVKAFTCMELADILINYFTLIYLKKTYWRLKYTIDSCKIVELDFIFKGLTKLPLAIKHLKALKKLTLRYNQITEIPEWINSLNSLEYLNLNVNNINKLPDNIGLLSKLKELLLWKNELQVLPTSICSLKLLEHLNLRLNQLALLPNDFGNLINLKTLNLHDNKLTYFPESLSALKDLVALNLSWNLLTALPSSINHLLSLKSLDLERNELVNVPSSIGSLVSLETLNLGDNKLETIPETIGKLKNLKSLNLSRNKLTVLPESISSLAVLEELYLGENNFNNYPTFLKKLEENGLQIYI